MEKPRLKNRVKGSGGYISNDELQRLSVEDLWIECFKFILIQ